MIKAGKTGPKAGTPDSRTYTLVMFLTRLWLGGRQRIVIEDQPLSEIKGPYVLLSNHES